MKSRSAIACAAMILALRAGHAAGSDGEKPPCAGARPLAVELRAIEGRAKGKRLPLLQRGPDEDGVTYLVREPSREATMQWLDKVVNQLQSASNPQAFLEARARLHGTHLHPRMSPREASNEAFAARMSEALLQVLERGPGARAGDQAGFVLDVLQSPSFPKESPLRASGELLYALSRQVPADSPLSPRFLEVLARDSTGPELPAAVLDQAIADSRVDDSVVITLFDKATGVGVFKRALPGPTLRAMLERVGRSATPNTLAIIGSSLEQSRRWGPDEIEAARLILKNPRTSYSNGQLLVDRAMSLYRSRMLPVSTTRDLLGIAEGNLGGEGDGFRRARQDLVTWERLRHPGIEEVSDLPPLIRPPHKGADAKQVDAWLDGIEIRIAAARDDAELSAARSLVFDGGVTTSYDKLPSAPSRISRILETLLEGERARSQLDFVLETLSPWSVEKTRLFFHGHQSLHASPELIQRIRDLLPGMDERQYDRALTVLTWNRGGDPAVRELMAAAAADPRAGPWGLSSVLRALKTLDRYSGKEATPLTPRPAPKARARATAWVRDKLGLTPDNPVPLDKPGILPQPPSLDAALLEKLMARLTPSAGDPLATALAEEVLSHPDWGAPEVRAARALVSHPALPPYVAEEMAWRVRWLYENRRLPASRARQVLEAAVAGARARLPAEAPEAEWKPGLVNLGNPWESLKAATEALESLKATEAKRRRRIREVR